MKARKSKLIALGLAALMAVSPLSSMAYAEELLIDDGEIIIEEQEENIEEEVEAPEEEAPAEEPVEEVAAAEDTDGIIDYDLNDGELIDEVGAESDGYTLVLNDDEYPITFYYDNDDYEDYSVSFWRSNGTDYKQFFLNSDGEPGDGTNAAGTERPWAKIYDTTEATCEESAYLWMCIVIDGHTVYSGATDDEEEAFVMTGDENEPVGHDYKLTGTHRAVNGCEVVVYEVYECQNETNGVCSCKNEIDGTVYEATDAYEIEGIDGIKFVDSLEPEDDSDPTGHIRNVIIAVQDNHDWVDQTPIIYVEGNTVEELEALGITDLSDDDKELLDQVVNTELADDMDIAIDEDTLDDREPIAISSSKDAVYAVISWAKCDNCDEVKQSVELKTIEAAAENWVEIRVLDEDDLDAVEKDGYETRWSTSILNGDDVLDGAIKETKIDGHEADMPDNEEIQVSTCKKTAWYILGYYGYDSEAEEEAGEATALLGYEVVTLPKPNHFNTYVTVEFASAEDAKACIVKYDDDGDLKSVTNTLCSRDITYYVVTHCSNPNCFEGACYSGSTKYYDEDGVLITEDSDEDDIHLNEIERVEEVAEKSDNHITHSEVEELVEDVTESEPISADDYEDIMDAVDEHPTAIEVTDNTSCTEEGTLTINILCLECGKVMETKTVKVEALGHDLPDTWTIEHVKAATCEEAGLDYRVKKCKRDNCDYEERYEVEQPRLAHTNETGVVVDRLHNVYGVDDIKNTNGQDIIFKFVGDTIIDVNSQLEIGDDACEESDKYALDDEYDVDYTYNNGVKGGATGTYTSPAIGIPYYAFYSEDFLAYGQFVTECTTCTSNPHTVVLNPDDVDGLEITQFEIIDLTRSTKAGKAGSITIEAKYTYLDEDGDSQTGTATETFDYYNSIDAYRGRVIDEPTVAVDPELEAYNAAVQYGKTIDANDYVYTNSDGAKTFTSSDELIATVDENGVITGVAYGEATITVDIAATENYNAASDTFTVYVEPVKTYIWQLRDEGEGTLLVRWSTSDEISQNVDGYRFAYATNSDFTDAKYSAVKVGVNHGRRYNLPHATYYVKVQTYKLIDASLGDVYTNRIYSGWSGVKTIDIKRTIVAPAKAVVSVSKQGNAKIDVTPKTSVDGYQVEFTAADGTKKTTSGFSTSFIRNIGSGTFTARVRAFKEAEDGRYFSAWIDAGSVTL